MDSQRVARPTHTYTPQDNPEAFTRKHPNTTAQSSVALKASTQPPNTSMSKRAQRRYDITRKSRRQNAQRNSLPAASYAPEEKAQHEAKNTDTCSEHMYPRPKDVRDLHEHTQDSSSQQQMNKHERHNSHREMKEHLPRQPKATALLMARTDLHDHAPRLSRGKQ